LAPTPDRCPPTKNEGRGQQNGECKAGEIAEYPQCDAAAFDVLIAGGEIDAMVYVIVSLLILPLSDQIHHREHGDPDDVERVPEQRKSTGCGAGCPP